MVLGYPTATTPPSRGEFLPNATFPAVNSVKEYREGRRGVLAGDGGSVSKGFLVSAATVVVGTLLVGSLVQGSVANAGADAGRAMPERLEELVQGPASPLHDSMEEVARRAMAMGVGGGGGGLQATQTRASSLCGVGLSRVNLRIWWASHATELPSR